jgi:hypothetical protein
MVGHSGYVFVHFHAYAIVSFACDTDSQTFSSDFPFQILRHWNRLTLVPEPLYHIFEKHANFIENTSLLQSYFILPSSFFVNTRK